MEIASTKEGQYEQVVETDSSGTFALKVKGNSIEPEFFDGDILIINNTLFHPNPD
ncbi:MAG: hypothetical protein GY786_01555 [Proteobacteria bacterium]|nr:hypothetical protein [Pseudomonadota bacterium]